MMDLYLELCQYCSKQTTKLYSTSFSLGIKNLGKDIQQPIYNIYGLVRLADEIVDTFHQIDQAKELNRFEEETFRAIEQQHSTNPIIHSFQQTVNEYNIGIPLIQQFFNSMRMDLERIHYNDELYKTYIDGSAEVVGLMCMHVFTKGDLEKYNALEKEARGLGSALQKVNFLRDLSTDYNQLGRLYFPNIGNEGLTEENLREITKDIEADFALGLQGIKRLDKSSRFAVYLVYTYFHELLKKIEQTPINELLTKRVRVSDPAKYWLYIKARLRYLFNSI